MHVQNANGHHWYAATTGRQPVPLFAADQVHENDDVKNGPLLSHFTHWNTI